MNIYRNMLIKIFKKLCIHSKEYKLTRPLCIPDEEGFYCFGKRIMLPELFDEWKECKSCILRNISWKAPHSMGQINRDICFAIWHQGFLERSKGVPK